MRSYERHELILKLLKRDGHRTVEELCRELQASPATIRRDLKELEALDRLYRFHGGARLKLPIGQAAADDNEAGQPPLETRLQEHAEEKARIAAYAATLVEEGDVIALTGGSTNIYLARNLKFRKDITVVTNSVTLALELGDHVEVILTGGKLRSSSMTLVGPVTEESLRNIRVRKIFMGVEAIDLQYGVTVHNFSEAHSDRRLALCADEAIVVVDHSKFGKILFTEVIPLSKVNRIITGEALPDESASALRKFGVALTQV